jgi:hypothetical protein
VIDNWSNHKTYEWPGHRKLSWNKEDMSDENLLVCRCITYKSSPCDIENPSNDAKGEDEWKRIVTLG